MWHKYRTLNKGNNVIVNTSILSWNKYLTLHVNFTSSDAWIDLNSGTSCNQRNPVIII